MITWGSQLPDFKEFLLSEVSESRQWGCVLVSLLTSVCSCRFSALPFAALLALCGAIPSPSSDQYTGTQYKPGIGTRLKSCKESQVELDCPVGKQ